MDKKTKERIMQKVEAFIKWAKENGEEPTEVKVASGHETFLTRNVKTKEQGDAIMRVLRGESRREEISVSSIIPWSE
jgi:hypothetical protein